MMTCFMHREVLLYLISHILHGLLEVRIQSQLEYNRVVHTDWDSTALAVGSMVGHTDLDNRD